jgi:uncharacterized protein
VIHLDAGGVALLAAASFIAAAINAAAGGGSLVSFPTLLALGMPPLAANVSNTVGLLPGYAGGSAAYRRELRGQRRAVVILGAVSVAGGVAGAVLLLRSGGTTFQAIVPWLILAACGLLAAQPALVRMLERRHAERGDVANPALLLGEFAAAVYGAFFGAGLGVLTLAALGLFLRDDMQRQNALKGVLSLVINVVAAVSFALFAPVSWTAVFVMLPAALLGGFGGVAVARRLSATALRVMVIVFGVGVAVRLLV